MKVKIGKEFHDPNIEPIMLILTDQDKINIRNMHKEAYKYCVYPDTYTATKIEKFMKETE